MTAILTHEDPGIQQALDALQVAGLQCVQVGKRGDQPGGRVLIVDGTNDLEVRRTAFQRAVEILEVATRHSCIYDLMADKETYDQVFIFGVVEDSCITLDRKSVV